jgi:Protease inhibitor Inh
VAPEGGCPGKLFMSRKWSFEQNALVLRNPKGEPLAQLSSAEPGRLEGRSISGEAISLTR